MNERILIKLGGASLSHPRTLGEAAVLIRNFLENENQVIVVHGGGPAINAELERRNINWQFINGQRQTTIEMMKVINEVLGHQVNRQIVSAFRTSNLHTVGINCADFKILECVTAAPELIQVGQITRVNTTKILEVFQSDKLLVPILAPIGIGKNNDRFNINADWAAMKIAAELQVDRLIFLTDQVGVLDSQKNPISVGTPEFFEALIADGTIQGGMMTKVRTMIAANAAGIPRVQVYAAQNASALSRSSELGTTVSRSMMMPHRLQNGSLWTQN